MPKIRQKIHACRILIVDDDPVSLRMLEALLRSDGYGRITTLNSALSLTDQDLDSHYDLLLLDLRMPDIDGLTVINQLRDRLGERMPSFPIIVLTSQSDPETRLRVLTSGARDFLGKPFIPAEVIQRVYNQLEMRVLYQERSRHAEQLELVVEERTLELRETQFEIIRRLARAGEHRDTDTGNHVSRMSNYCAALARAIGLDERSCEQMLHASQMHDIGKIGIPDSILLKPDRLTAEERRIIETHAAIGAKILEGSHSRLLECARIIALSHHEKWDGSGYPLGLAGEEIPLEGRITALCDVFDALTMVRPYKRAWPVEDAVAFLQAEAGKHFDPVLVTAFTGILEQILQIRARYQDEGV